MLFDLYCNHIYGRTPWYYKQFAHIGHGSRVWYPCITNRKTRASMVIGENSQILQNSRIWCYEQDNLPKPRIQIGDHCYLGYHLSILAGADVTIDDWVLMASDILITTESHGMDPESPTYYMDQPLTVAPVHIKSGCWIGEKVVIMPGVTIGEKCIIGVGSIVTKDIPDYCIAVGNPAKVIKKYDFDTHEWVRV